MKLYWTRPGNAQWRLLLQKTTLVLLKLLLLFPFMFLLAKESSLQGYGQTASFSDRASRVPDAVGLPNAPSASQISSQNSRPQNIFRPSHHNLPPAAINHGGKFQYLVEPAFGPRAFVFSALSAGMRMTDTTTLKNYPRDWRVGPEGYGHLYEDTFVRNGARSIASFSTSVLLHEDPRYHPSENTSISGRVIYALTFTLIDRTDGGHATLAISNFTGAAAGGFIGNAYFPSGFNNLTHAGQRSGLLLGSMASQNIMQEFSPELSRFIKRLHISHIPLPPVWWTGGK